MKRVAMVAVLIAACASAPPASPVSTPSPVATPSAVATATVGPTPTSTPAEPTAAEAHSISGTVTLDDPSADYPGDASCAGQGGYADIRSGTEVTVRDEASVLIATSELLSGAQRPGGLCVFAFQVAVVPVATFYSIEVGDRGEVSYSFDDLADADWTVVLTLGG